MDYKKLLSFGFVLQLVLSIILTTIAAVSSKISLFQISNSIYWIIPLFGSIVYIENLRKKSLFQYIAIPVFAVLSFFLFRTTALGAMPNAILYLVTLGIFVIVFDWMWYNQSMKILRSIKFSAILASVFSVLRLFLMNLFVYKKGVNPSIILNDFFEIFLLFLMFTLAATISDMVIIKIAKKNRIYELDPEYDTDVE
jgi:hypothetical protein